MLFLNRGGRRAIDESVERIHGEVFLPAFNSIAAMRNAEHSSRLLVDPQLYLAGLPVEECGKVCGKLASFPWFGVEEVPDFSSGDKRKDWDEECRQAARVGWTGEVPAGDDITAAVDAAIAFQLELRAAYLILPTPLIRDREDEGQTAAEWLDEGLAAVERLRVAQPVLASIAIDEGALNAAAFEPGSFVDTVIDLVTARDGLNGAYIVIPQSRKGHPFETSDSVTRAYLHLVRGFVRARYPTVITNFADVFGLVAMGAGASALATGPTQSTRRISLEGFRDTGGGGPYPHLYSHPCVAEFSVGDLPRIEQSRALSRVKDVTEFSRALFDASGRRLATPTPGAWAESMNNVTESLSHLIARLAIEAQELGRVRGQPRQDMVSDWLEGAVANALFLERRIGAPALRTMARFAPVDDWLTLFADAMA